MWPCASITRVAGPASAFTSSVVPTFRMVLPATATACAMVPALSIVWTLPFTMIRSAAGAVLAAGAGALAPPQATEQARAAPTRNGRVIMAALR